MIQTSTENNLLKYLYGETTHQESRDIELERLLDAELDHSLSQVTQLAAAVDACVMEPNEQIVSRLLSRLHLLKSPEMSTFRHEA